MAKKFTTSAKKLYQCGLMSYLKSWNMRWPKIRVYCLSPQKRKNIKEAKIADGSKLVIAAFEKSDGKVLAMLDYKDIPDNKERVVIQRQLRVKLEEVFK